LQARATKALRLLVRLVLVCLAITLGLLCVFAPPTLVDQIELRILDWHARLRGPLPAPQNISIVAIDETSLELVGRWPWPRTRTAEIIRRLAEGGAKVIALDILMNEPDENSRLVLARTLAERYRALGLPRASGPAAEFSRVIEGALADADTDATLAQTMADTRRVLLPYFFVFEHEVRPLDDEGRRLLNRSRVVGFASADAEQAIQPRRAEGVQLPLARFITASATNGHVNVYPDDDGALRRMELVIRFGDGLYPSLALESTRLALGLSRTRVRVTANREVQLGSTRVPTDDNGVLMLTYYGKARTFQHIPAVNVLTDSAPPDVKDHIVLVGFTAHGLMDVRPTPFDSVMPGVESHATAIANMLEGRGLQAPVDLGVIETIAVILLGVVGPLLLPRVGAIWGTVVALGLAIGVTGLVHYEFRQGVWILLLPPLLALAVGHVGSVTYQVLTENRERRWIKQAFRQYVPPAVVEELGRDPSKLTFGGERKVLTVMFSDIRGFTTYSELHPPEEVVAALHEYLTALVEVVFRHRGTLDKFIGDATMAFFGAPFDNPDHALQACRAAVEMSDVVARLNERWKAAGRGPFVTGFGIATGEMLVGNFGSSQRFTYTVIGDQVNLGARLESLNKDYETARHIIISQGTYELVRDHVEVRALGSVTVKGKQQAVDIFDLVGLKEPVQEASS
jgi:adenylate cyclase